MILITSPSEFLLSFFSCIYFTVSLLSFSSQFIFFLGNPSLLGRSVSWSLGVCPVFAVGIHVPMGKEFREQVDQSQCSTRVQF